MGFDRLRVAGYTLASYFPGIVQTLEAAGNRVLVPFLTPTGGVAQRARELKDFLLANSQGEPVHLIAHSMGGLDSRYMISCLEMEKHVLSLTTMGTPHRGTTFADWGIHRLARIVRPILTLLGLPNEGFYDVTCCNCKTFNEKVPNAEGVRYFSVAGEHDGSYFNPEWLLPYNIVHQAEGPNDGVVSIASAKWGEDLDVWAGDHLSLINWFNPLARNRGFFRDPAPRYSRIVGKLADCGF